MIIPEVSRKESEAKGMEERRLCEMLGDIKGAGAVDVLVTYYPDSDEAMNGLAMGAVITAEGADDFSVKNKLSEAVQAALGLPPHKVKVFKKSLR